MGHLRRNGRPQRRCARANRCIAAGEGRGSGGRPRDFPITLVMLPVAFDPTVVPVIESGCRVKASTDDVNIEHLATRKASTCTSPPASDIPETEAHQRERRSMYLGCRYSLCVCDSWHAIAASFSEANRLTSTNALGSKERELRDGSTCSTSSVFDTR